MIETIAVAAVLASVYEALRWDRGGSRVHFVAAIALAALAALLKITTAAIWLAPAVFLLHRSRLASIALVATAAVVGVAWTTYADGDQGGVTGDRLADQRRRCAIGTSAPSPSDLTPTPGGLIFLRWLPGLGLVVFLAPFVIWRSRIGVWALGTLLLGPLVFTNLSHVHDYYWMAVGPAAAILIGLVVDRALQVEAPGRRVAAVAVLAGVFALSFYVYPRWTLMLRPGGAAAILERAAQIEAATTPNDLVAISGYGWSPELLFYADRYGYMEDARVPPAPAGYIHFHCLTGAKGVCTPD